VGAGILPPVSTVDGDEDWRLRAELHGEGARPHGILARFRGPQADRDAQEAVGSEVVLTHDGASLFAYAADRAALDRARAPLEAALSADGLQARVTVAHWQDDLGEWTQVDPPLEGAERDEHERAVRDAHAPAAHTFVVQVGREERPRFEQSMREWAERLGLRCEVVEHPHLLRTQVAFTVSGTAREVQEFRDGLRAEEWQTVKAAEGIGFSV
jgi:hypothetical protein